jgi:uncharacterized protein
MIVRLLAGVLLVAGALPVRGAAQQPAPQPVPPRLARLVPPSPTPASFIADVPHLLTPAARETLDARIRAVQDSGYGDIGVAIMPSIADYPPYEMGTAIYRTWRIGRIDSLGSARRDLGVLLLIVPKELAPDSAGHCWITTGNGAEGMITDATGGAICRDQIIPHLRDRNYPAAIGAGIDAISARIRAGLTGVAPQGAASTVETERASRSGPIALVIGGLLALGGLGAGIPLWLRRRARRCPKCGRTMHRLDETHDDAALQGGQLLEERIGSVDYDVWQCECGETLVLPYRNLFSGYSVCEACKVRAVKTKRTVIQQPTYTSTGLAEDVSTCENCQRTTSNQVVLARRTPPAASGSSGGGGRGGGGGGGGGGRSFGGSGRTSGGGGGSRY